MSDTNNIKKIEVAVPLSADSELTEEFSSKGLRKCNGILGVPITFLDPYCADQFSIVGIAKRGAGDPSLKSHIYTKEEYSNYSDLNATPTINRNGVLKNTYPRILIRRKI